MGEYGGVEYFFIGMFFLSYFAKGFAQVIIGAFWVCGCFGEQGDVRRVKEALAFDFDVFEVGLGKVVFFDFEKVFEGVGYWGVCWVQILLL